MNLPVIVEYLIGRPLSGPEDLVRLKDDGDGPFIEHWDASLGPQPTQQQLKDAEAAALKARDDRLEAEKLEREAVLNAAKDLAASKGKTGAAAVIQGKIDAL